MAEKTWFITGASQGLGREWAIAALDRGDGVASPPAIRAGSPRSPSLTVRGPFPSHST